MAKPAKDSPDARLAAFLIDQRLISQELLDKALDFLEAYGGYLSEILVSKGLIAEDDVAFSLSEEFGVPLLSAQNGSMQPIEDQELIKLIPKQFALRNLIFPLARKDSVFSCVMFNPLDVMLIDELRKITGCRVKPVRRRTFSSRADASGRCRSKACAQAMSRMQGGIYTGGKRNRFGQN